MLAASSDVAGRVHHIYGGELAQHCEELGSPDSNRDCSDQNRESCRIGRLPKPVPISVIAPCSPTSTLTTPCTCGPTRISGVSTRPRRRPGGGSPSIASARGPFPP